MRNATITSPLNPLTAVYTRVSTSQQSNRSQKPDLKRWIDAQNPDTLGQVKWFHDSATGKNMDRPGWQKLQRAIDAGQVRKLVVCRHLRACLA